MKKTLLLLVCLAFLQLTCICQESIMDEKVDQTLLRMIEKQRSLDSATSVTAKCSVKKKKGKNVQNKTYDCIVYTDNAQALRDSGIIVNSVFPSFVTTLVTAEQIGKMSKMPFVKFIAASARNEKELN